MRVSRLGPFNGATVQGPWNRGRQGRGIRAAETLSHPEDTLPSTQLRSKLPQPKPSANQSHDRRQPRIAIAIFQLSVDRSPHTGQLGRLSLAQAKPCTLRPDAGAEIRLRRWHLSHRTALLRSGFAGIGSTPDKAVVIALHRHRSP
jgi:hypothetical protein